MGTRDHLSADDLRQLINALAETNAEPLEKGTEGATVGYFLRWAHGVSGLVNQLPENFPSPQGQLLTPQLELRWQQQRLGYDSLLLSTSPVNKEHGFQPLAERFSQESDQSGRPALRPVLAHPRRGPQYPKAFTYSGLEARQLRQRYFRNARTGIVQFVALTLMPKVPHSGTQPNNTQPEVAPNE